MINMAFLLQDSSDAPQKGEGSQYTVYSISSNDVIDVKPEHMNGVSPEKLGHENQAFENHECTRL